MMKRSIGGLAVAMILCLSAPAMAQTSPQPVAKGGTSRSTITAHALMFGAGTNAFTLYSCASGFLAGTGASSDPACRALVGADLPNPSTSSLGGVQSKTCSASQWLNVISTSGVPACAQPAFTDVSGTATAAQGGTGQSSYAIGDTLYASGSSALSKLAGNTTTTRKFLRQTGTGSASQAPVWDTVVAADVPGSAVTKTDDTNVTMTLGGSPTTAALNAFSMTIGWTGQLGVARGGTGLASGTSGGVPCFTGTTTIASSSLLTANGPLLGGGAGVCPSAMAAGTDAQLIVGQTGGAALWKTITGDVTFSAAGAAAIGTNKVTDTMVRQSGALALIGRSANSTGNVADIQASAGSSCAFRESSSTIGCGTLATAAYAANSVTNAKLAQMANATFKCRNTAGTGDPEDCTATQSTALLNSMGADSGSGGIKGLVPAPGAGDASAGKFLKADATWAVPAGGGGGGGMTDTERQNSLLVMIYQSKSFSEYRRLVNLFATGFKGASDALNGIVTGSSSNYSVDNSNGRVAPSTTAGTDLSSTSFAISQGSDAASPTNAFDNSGATSWQGQHSGAGVNAVDYIGQNFGSGNEKAIVSATIRQDNGSNNDVTSVKAQYSTNGTCSSGWTDVSGSPYTITTSTGVQTIGPWTSVGVKQCWRLLANTGTGGGNWLVQEVEFIGPVTNNSMVLVTAAQTTDASVSNGRALIEYNPVDAITLNTDVTADVSCNGGSNWAAATLSSTTAFSGTSTQRSVAETADTACTSGTSGQLRLKTFNNKSVQFYGASLTLH